MTNETHVTGEPKLSERRLSTSISTKMIPAAWQTPLPPRIEASEDSVSAEAAAAIPSQPLTRAAVSKLLRQTKIIATLGPSTDDGGVLRNLLEAGVSVFRVDLACISRESALKAVYAIRSISTELQRPVALLLETQTVPHGGDSTAMTESDWAVIRFGLEAGVDWLAVSAGRHGEAVRQLRQFLADQKRNGVNILARIANPPSLVELDQIIRDADGIILSGVNPSSECPGTENSIIVQKCVSARKLSVIVTSADAEVTAALAAQPDALLVTEALHAGSDPVQSVQRLDGLIRRGESNGGDSGHAAIPLVTELDQSVAAAVRQADETDADAIVVFTRLGNSAGLCAALRPRQSRIFAFTPDARLARRLRLRYALEPIVLPFADQPNKTLQAAEKLLLERRLLSSGAKIVYVTDLLDRDERISSVLNRVLGSTTGKAQS